MSTASRQPASSSRKTTYFRVVDVQKVTITAPGDAVKTVAFTTPDTIIHCDLLIVGGGMGGVSAALSAAKTRTALEEQSGRKRGPLRICLIEETDWLGGQMTSQGVSALDENPLVETSGSSRSYQLFRDAIREHYKAAHQLDDISRQDPWLNPGDCWVSWLSFEPKVAVELIDRMLAPHIAPHATSIFLRHKPIYIKTTTQKQSIDGKDIQARKVTAVGTVDLETGKCSEFRPKICLDATELGDLLPMAAVDYRSGAESIAETGEPHAPEKANPENVQDFTYPFVVEFCPGENHTIAKPPFFDEFNQSGKFSFQGYSMFACQIKGEGDDLSIARLPFWEYRRLIAKSKFTDRSYAGDLSMINWDSNDLRGENIIDKPPEAMCERLARAKALSLGFLYWLQTEAPRDEGGAGYPELKLRKDILSTEDGLSMFPYIRESRRSIARYRIVEQDIVESTNSGARAKEFHDSVGIGHYPVDIHGHQDVPGAQQRTRRFQIPLSALLPKQTVNLLPACKNIGTTHVTNGAYRLHPIEWSIGEAQGALAALALARSGIPHRILERRELLLTLQLSLIKSGVPLYWYNDVPTTHDAFVAIQFLSITGIMRGPNSTLAFEPDKPVTEEEAASAIAMLEQNFHNKFRRDWRTNLITKSNEDTLSRAEFAMRIMDCISA